MKKRSKGWPLRMWAVCYRSIDHAGGWVPYSGQMYWYRDDARHAALEHDNSKVKSFDVYARVPGSASGDV